MFSLLIDTSSNMPVVALNKNDKTLIYKYLDYKKELSSALFPTIVELLENAKISSNDLKFIAIGKGPGSYTGLRSGASAAKALAYGLNIPIVGFCSLKCFLPSQKGLFFSIVDAKSGGVYLLEGIKNESVVYKGDPILLSLDQLESYLSKGHYIASPDIEALKKKLSHLKINEERFMTAFPDVDHLARLVFYKLQNNNSNSLEKLNILYLRGPSPLAL